jgi:hypothetical protein
MQLSDELEALLGFEEAAGLAVGAACTKQLLERGMAGLQALARVEP